ncbi:hypothetical protein [Methylobacterium sp. D54C]
MSADKHKTEPPFGLDIDFGEALERFIATRPKEVEEGIQRARQKKVPDAQVAPKSGSVGSRKQGD